MFDNISPRAHVCYCMGLEKFSPKEYLNPTVSREIFILRWIRRYPTEVKAYLNYFNSLLLAHIGLYTYHTTGTLRQEDVNTGYSVCNYIQYSFPVSILGGPLKFYHEIAIYGIDNLKELYNTFEHGESALKDLELQGLIVRYKNKWHWACPKIPDRIKRIDFKNIELYTAIKLSQQLIFEKETYYPLIP